jgi:hypothetical protein
MRLPTDLRLAAVALSAASFLLSAVGLARPPAPLATVVAAARPLPAGTLLTAGDVRLTHLPSAPPGAVDSLAHALGRRLVAPLLGGDPVLRTFLAPAGQPGFVLTLPAAAPAEPGQEAAIAFLPASGPPRLLAQRIRVTGAVSGAGTPQASVVVPPDLATLLLAAQHAGTVVVLPETP